jgi:hypothetical protein
VSVSYLIMNIPVISSKFRNQKLSSGPAKIGFWWKTDANYNGIAQLNFLANSERKYTYDSKKDKYEFYELRYDGEYILTWEFIKYRSYPHNFGAGWIRDINLSRRLP